MFLKEMKTLFKFFFIFIFPFCVSAQINTFKSSVNKPFTDFSIDTMSCYSDTTQRIGTALRFNGINSFNKEKYSSSYLLGLSVSANVRNKVTFISYYDYLGGKHNSLINEYQDSLGVFPSFGREKDRFQFNLKYKLNRFVIADFGRGTNFIGDGYRSLFLSSSHSPYPYFKLKTEFGRVKYYNLYTTFLDIQNETLDRKKHSSIHFLDFSLTKNISLGVFEGVIWQAKDENYTRGYDVEYLNPVIFYRPVEFSKHSPDNVLMGSSLKVQLKSFTAYAQVLLDDLNISRQKDRDENFSGGFFQNKFAYQLGVKASLKQFKALVEYNQSQPYTYAHKEPMQSYTHMNQALAHPLGSNFKEIVFLTDVNKGRLKYKVKYTYAMVGLDSLTTHYGQNIFVSDFNAQRDGDEYSYGNFNGQGVLTNIQTLYAEASYSLNWFDVFGSVFYKKKKSNLNDQTSLMFSVGIRTFLFPTFQDY